MRYYINTNQGVCRDSKGQVIAFDIWNNARHWVINHLDLSERGIEIVDGWDGKHATVEYLNRGKG
jgi:hypothetical protein